MNIKERLRHLARVSTKDRQTGRTTRLISLAKEIGAIFLTHDHNAAHVAERSNPGLKARSVDVNLDGYTGPFVFDHFAVESLFDRAANKIEELEKVNKNLTEEQDFLKQRIKNLNEIQQDTESVWIEAMELVAADKDIMIKYINEIHEAGYGEGAQEVLDRGRYFMRKAAEAAKRKAEEAEIKDAKEQRD